MLRRFRRYIRNNGRIHDQEANNIYNLALLYESDIPEGVKRQIVTRCNVGTHNGFNTGDRFQIDFRGRQYSASCVECLLEAVMKTRNKSVAREPPSRDISLLIFTLVFFLGFSGLTWLRRLADGSTASKATAADGHSAP